MAPRIKRFRKSLPSDLPTSSKEKENYFVRSVNDFQARVRRRESFRIRTIKEVDLEQKIELEIKMREGTTKLLAACKHQAQSLEAAKSLLTSNERMSTYMAELHRRKRLPNTNRCSQGSKARVCLSDLRIPLIWRDTDHFKNKGDYRRFAVFCLVRVGTELYDTSLLCPVDRSLTDLTFPDILVFKDVTSDFVCSVEVYSHMLRDDMSIASTRRKIKNTIHSSISRTVGKKLAASLRDELNSTHIGPQFELMASARLTLEDVNNQVRTHDLKLEHTDSKSGEQLPLFGHFCCRLAAAPYCHERVAASGPIVSVTATGHCQALGIGKLSSAGWASLKAFRLCLWTDRNHWQHSAVSLPLLSIPVNTDTVVKFTKGGSEIILVNEVEGKEVSTTLKFSSPDEKDTWLQYIAQHINDHTRWKSAAEKVMEIYTPGSGKEVFTKPARQGSLYDQTPIIENLDSNSLDKRSLTPSTSLSSCSSNSPPPQIPAHRRERSLSTSSKPRRSHWPFN